MAKVEIMEEADKSAQSVQDAGEALLRAFTRRIELISVPDTEFVTTRLRHLTY